MSSKRTCSVLSPSKSSALHISGLRCTFPVFTQLYHITGHPSLGQFIQMRFPSLVWIPYYHLKWHTKTKI